MYKNYTSIIVNIMPIYKLIEKNFNKH